MEHWFRQDVLDAGKLRLFCFFVAFICGFLFIRVSVRLIRADVRWWFRDVTPGGAHIHHVVFGVAFMCVGGVTGLAVTDPESGWAAVAAAVFGVGTALVLDEFALVFHLQDVYWSEEGRLSVEVVFIAISLTGLTLIGFSPFGLGDRQGEEDSLWIIAAILVSNLAFSVVALLKGRTWLGLVGLYLGFFALFGALRLARPSSPWAHRFYPNGSRKMTRAARREQRYTRVDDLMRRLQNLIAGAPDDERPPPRHKPPP
ncbi:hypothetical protein LO762_09885 [Actinocorallia sp. API 0066]|uniref:hypothetical protein n=1 Tax=Actinocorallia sp. API 0066 TaxID=2896846 RepID=UPI001E62AA1B|nr:hypothetical protein [Actinocorallia sp. API 0066]MCD0449499.1 hypothetical protein [Actinocorallia sp. API 0066]